MKKLLIIVSLFAVLLISCNNHHKRHGKECDSIKVESVAVDTTIVLDTAVVVK